LRESCATGSTPLNAFQHEPFTRWKKALNITARTTGSEGKTGIFSPDTYPAPMGNLADRRLPQRRFEKTRGEHQSPVNEKSQARRTEIQEHTK